MSQTQQSVDVTITAGVVRGAAHDGVAVFKAIPFAAPPVGVNRFAPPQPVQPWSGVRDVRADGPIAPQTRARLATVMGEIEQPQSEDCLTLNVWTPAPDRGRRPVVVWLHGGAYLCGSASLSWYDGETLAREGDLVFVGVNYRLGMLGYLRKSGVSAGEQGLLDQAAALAWVQDNIAAFGGDPEQVTVMGQSAGAGTILLMLARADMRRYFRRAIIQSAPFRREFLSYEEAEAAGRRFIELLDLSPDAPDIGARLREVSIARVLEAQSALARERARFGRTALPFRPVPDVETVEALWAAAADGAVGREILMGTTREELAAWYAQDPKMMGIASSDAETQATALTGSTALWPRYRAARPAGSPGYILCDVATDQDFRFGGLSFASDVARRGGRAFVYQFDWSPAASPYKACHCIELPFVFGTSENLWADAPMLAGGAKDEITALGATVRRSWIAFARSGDPATPALPWPAYEAQGRQTMRLDTVCGVVGDLAGLAWKTA